MKERARQRLNERQVGEKYGWISIIRDYVCHRRLSNSHESGLNDCGATYVRGYARALLVSYVL
jgi:hypothetical protein